MTSGISGKCCRDPNYKDPWPAGMMMKNNGFDDGFYHPDQSATINYNAGLYYNTPKPVKGHTVKVPLGVFNQNPTPFPTKSSTYSYKPSILTLVPYQPSQPGYYGPVSYTHLDVYKRQILYHRWCYVRHPSCYYIQRFRQ